MKSNPGVYRQLDEPRPIRHQTWPSGTVPLLSIVCCTYNHVEFIRECVEGFLMQETTFPVEVLIHDDASTDGTAEIVCGYQTRYPDLIKAVLQTENQYSKGGSPGRDTLTRAKGEFIALCEGDDYWISPHKLQKQVEILLNFDHLSMTFHNVWVRHSRSRDDYFLNHGLDKDTFSLDDVLLRPWFIGTASMLYRKKCLVLPRALSFASSGDLLMQFGLAARGDLHYMDEVMSVYRIHPGGISYSWHNDKKVGKEKMRTCHFWSHFDYAEEIFSGKMPLSVRQCLINIIQDLVDYFIALESDCILPTRGRITELTCDCFERAKPALLSRVSFSGLPFVGVHLTVLVTRSLGRDARAKIASATNNLNPLLVVRILWHGVCAGLFSIREVFIILVRSLKTIMIRSMRLLLRKVLMLVIPDSKKFRNA